MSMIPVISLNVIRQAIEWHDITPPIEIRTVSTFDFPGGKRQTTLYAHFNIAQVVKDLGLSHFHETSRYAFLYRLQECFCQDVQVIDVTAEPGDDECVVKLSCTIEKHDDE